MSYLSALVNHIDSRFINRGKILHGEASCKDIEIKGKYIIFQTDHKDFKANVINTLYTPGAVRCVCDYVIVSDDVVLVCELKSNNEGQMKTQLKNTGRLIKYLLEMVKQHSDINFELPPIKYVCFAKMYKSVKQTTTRKLTSIEWNNSELFQLPCNSRYSLKQFN